MKKKKLTNITINIIIGIFGILLLYSIFNIIKWNIDSKKLSNQIDNINDIISIDDFDNKDAVIVSNNADDKDPYWSYIKMNLIDVNLNELRKINSDTKGWIKVNGTNINYPFVQTSNNDYYLKNDYYHNKNYNGWIFADYRNDIDKLDQNTIIYGHNKYLNQTMFGTLNNVLNEEWQNNNENLKITFNNLYENMQWQIFSIYKIHNTNDYLTTSFSSKAAYKKFLNVIKNRSIKDFNVDVTKEDKILTISTCVDNNKRLVIHAKLIKNAS